jgi:hypothetical protein
MVPKACSYLLVLRNVTSMDAHIVGSAGGNFCPACPVVVLDRDQFNDYAAMNPTLRAGSTYLMPGLVDLSVVPEDKRHLPFDEADNPLPLVMFTNL